MAARHKLPAIYAQGTAVRAGGLISYGNDQVMYKNIPHKSIKKILANKTKHIKQMLYEYEQDTYFVRYSSVL
jgi:hypothetical protein